jgi:hypothetical protein
VNWRLGLGDTTGAALHVVSHPQTSHNPINLDFLLDPLSKSEFLSLKHHGKAAHQTVMQTLIDFGTLSPIIDLSEVF